MAVDSLLIVFNGGLAVLLSYGGLFKEYEDPETGQRDRWTPTMIAYAGSALWFILGISSFDVRLGGATSGGSVVMSFVVIGLALGSLVFLFATYSLLKSGTEDIDRRATGEDLIG